MSSFVICINNDSNPASLILGKVTARCQMQRRRRTICCALLMRTNQSLTAISNPASMFAPIELPEVAERALMAAED